jgi:hypothetical protein
MYLKINETNEGDAPSEKIVKILTAEGPEEVAVHSSLIKGNQMEVGYIGARQGTGLALVELPRETLKGKWRVWVSRADLKLESEMMPAE